MVKWTSFWGWNLKTLRLTSVNLVIGLLVLYGEVDKFLGVEFKNPEAARLWASNLEWMHDNISDMGIQREPYCTISPLTS